MRLWAFARVELGMTWRELGKLSLRQFDALRRQHESKVRREHSRVEILIDQIASLICIAGNSSFRGYESELTRSQFLPAGWEERYGPAEDDGPELTFDEQIDRAMARMEAFQRGRELVGG